MRHPPRLVVLSIDGVPHGLLAELMAAGHMPAVAGLCQAHGRPRMMRSVLPTVSNVAWTCYATGRNPGKHGVYGFIDRKPGTYEMFFPNAAHVRGRHIWQMLSEGGMKVFGMNVPGTYPPRAVNGVLIGGFLSPSAAKAAYPPQVGAHLEEIGYRVDCDSQLARRDTQAMLVDLDQTLAKRAEAMFHFLAAERWDFFHAHIMGTDRINHFLLAGYRQRDGRWAGAFVDYYRKVDSVIARLLAEIGAETPLVVLSDHGFCEILHEVQLSRYLVETGWTTPAKEVAGPLSFDPGRTKAYTLIPGRIYVNLRGREAQGCVPIEEYQQVRQAVADDLMRLRDPKGRPVIRKVLKREEIYWPAGQAGPDAAAWAPPELPPYSAAPDLVAVPFDGYDLKLGLTSPEIFVNTQLEGMHTYHDALLLTRNVRVPEGDFEIRQLAGVILETLGAAVPSDMDVKPSPPPEGVL